jgi:hypothetical protein
MTQITSPLSSGTGALPAPPPRVPATLADAGLPHDQLTQLLVKALYVGELSGTQLGDRLCLPYSLLQTILDHVRVEKLVEVRGASGAGTAGYRYALTDLGRDRCHQYLETNQYVGAAPVPLPGNGKTVIAEGIGRTLGGDMYMPRAIDVDGQIITMFDPVNHESLEAGDESDSVIATASSDRRWVRIRRPVVTVGGELTLDMLDLSFNQISKFYEAPLQLKSNGGVFVVDDFGRQRIRPRDLLNRWIVPLESRRDYLTLHTGKKFEVPFDVFIIFATNLRPETLADEAFLRRIPYKIYAKNPTFEEFSRIFELNCRRRNLAFDPVIVEYLQRKYYQPRGVEMRCCHPRDLVEQVVDMSKYQNRAPAITRELLDAACASYFIEEAHSQGGNGDPVRPGAASRDKGKARRVSA